MGKEEAFFFPAVRNAVAEVISAELEGNDAISLG